MSQCPVASKRAERLLSAIFLALLPAALLGMAAAQEARQNPYSGRQDAIREGTSIFRLNCAPCHGIDARGGRGPDLRAGRFLHGDSDEALFKTITKGVPGTEMSPGDQFSETEVWMVVAFLRSLTASPDVSIKGDAASGEKIFFGEGLCSQCHMVRGKGGRLGPDLTRVGALRSPRFLIESIREPEKEVHRSYETVTVIDREGKKVTGARRNEDGFSVQLMDPREELHLLLKADLKQVVYEKKSLMPAYDERVLNDSRLQDLIAYLYSLHSR